MSDQVDDVEKAKAEIAATRAALAETTAALAVKADVKTRATASIKANQTVIAAVAGGLALVVVLTSWRKSKSAGKKRKKR